MFHGTIKLLGAKGIYLRHEKYPINLRFKYVLCFLQQQWHEF